MIVFSQIDKGKISSIAQKASVEKQGLMTRILSENEAEAGH
jgi:hypothetical protein